MRVLLLGGTGEARALASALEGHDVVSSLAGRNRDPLLPEGEVRVGGFGGARGLADFLRADGIEAVVDATHPFAARITRHAADAARATGIPSVVLRRPPWDLHHRDLSVPSVAEAAENVAGRVFLTIGRQQVAAFADVPGWFLIRSIEPPDEPLPKHHELLLGRGPFTLEDEISLLQHWMIDVLVTKNSGGAATAAKVEAARRMDVRIVMVERPPLPEGVFVVDSVDAVQIWLAAQSG